MHSPGLVRHISSLIVAGALLTGATAVHAQSPVTISGRIVGPDNAPLSGARVTATVVVTPPVSHTDTSDARGMFTIVVPGGGDRFVVHVALAGFAAQRRTVERQPGDTATLRADFQLAPQRAQTLATVKVVGQRPRPPRSGDVLPGQVGTSALGLEATDLGGLMSGDFSGDLAAALSTIPGATLVPDPNGGPPGISVFGLSPDQNSVTLNGLAIDPASVPIYGTIAQVSVGAFDPGQRGGSGAHVIFSVPRGVRSPMRDLRATLEHPWLQWTDPAAPGNGGRYTQGVMSAMVSGPVARERAFYNVLFQLDRRSSELSTLATASPGALQGLGLSADSAARALGVAQRLGIPTRTGAVPDDQLSTHGSLFARLDWDRDSNTTLGLTVSGMAQGSDALPGPTALPSSGREVGSWSLGITPSLSHYLRGSVLNETRLALSASSNGTQPYLALPGAQVRVDSRLADGTAGSAGLLLGGSPAGTLDSRRSSAQLRNVTSWYTMDREHLFELTLDGQLQRSRSTVSPGLGAFAFNSLADLESGRPASFTRTLGDQTHELSDASWLLGASDTYNPFQGLVVRYGMQLQGAYLPTSPAYNPLVETLFDRRTDRMPGGVGWSPMLSFDWRVGAFGRDSTPAMAYRVPRFGTLSGNLARRRGVIGASMVDMVARSTGLPGSLAQLTCVGAAVPLPDWEAYLAAEGAVPTTCADGTEASPLAQDTPPVSLFAPGFEAPLTWDANLGWRRSLWRGVTATVGATYRRSTDLPGSYDLNFDPTVRFTLPAEGDRPVYVSPASIDPVSGAVASRESRRFDELARVSEYRSDQASEVRQIRVGLSGRFPSRPGRLQGYASVSYAYQELRDRTRAFSGGTTAGDPRELAWGRSGADARHQVTVRGSVGVRGWFSLIGFGTFRSPTPFTPIVGGDINGDGYMNDQAFVFDPATTADPALAEGMATLLATNPEAARCLRGQLGAIARRNACTGSGWTSQFNLQIIPGQNGLNIGDRTRVFFGVTNVLGAVDRLLHGTEGMRGWGQWGHAQASDPTLLRVRGFDQATGRFEYDVNPSFATNRAARAAYRAPFRVTLSVRVNLSPNPESARISRALRPDAADSVEVLSASQIFERVMPSAPTPLEMVIMLGDSLSLTEAQLDSLKLLDRRLKSERESIYRALAEYLATLGGDYGSTATRLRWRQATTDAMQAWMRLAPATLELLTPEQRERLPLALRQTIEASARQAGGG